MGVIKMCLPATDGMVNQEDISKAVLYPVLQYFNPSPTPITAFWYKYIPLFSFPLFSVLLFPYVASFSFLFFSSFWYKVRRVLSGCRIQVIHRVCESLIYVHRFLFPIFIYFFFLFYIFDLLLQLLLVTLKEDKIIRKKYEKINKSKNHPSPYFYFHHFYTPEKV